MKRPALAFARDHKAPEEGGGNGSHDDENPGNEIPGGICRLIKPEPARELEGRPRSRTFLQRAREPRVRERRAENALCIGPNHLSRVAVDAVKREAERRVSLFNALRKSGLDPDDRFRFALRESFLCFFGRFASHPQEIGVRLKAPCHGKGRRRMFLEHDVCGDVADIHRDPEAVEKEHQKREPESDDEV